MEKKRMKKLAGINEGSIMPYKNGRFKLERFDFWFDTLGHEQTDVNPKGNWCQTDAVAELEAIANKMYDILNQLDRVSPDGFGLKDIKRDALAVIAKAKTL